MVETLLSQTGGIWQEKFGNYFRRLNFEGEETLFVLPQRYMNRSGEAVQPLLRYFRIEPADAIVVHDDLDLPLGAVRYKLGGSAGGHHGVENLALILGTPDFYRVRLGIGRPEEREATNWVLGEPNSEELSVLREAVACAADGVRAIVSSGLKAAQQHYSRKGAGISDEIADPEA